MPMCQADGCLRPDYVRGYCKMHYSRWWRHGDLDHVGTPGGGDQPGTRVRSFVVLARDVRDQWRAWNTAAINHDEAARKYEKVFDYEVMGVALLEGSGHPVLWLREVEVPPVIPEWLPESWKP